MPKMKTYAKWPKGADKRWIHMANQFGHELMVAARNYAYREIPDNASREAKTAAMKAALDAIYGTLMLLDGVSGEPLDDQHRVEYALVARVRNKNDELVEQIELTPNGDGLCMGYHDWVTEPLPGQSKTAKKGDCLLWKSRFYMNESSELMQFYQSSLDGPEKWFYVLVAENGCGLVPGDTILPDRLPARAVRADIFVESNGESIAYFHKAHQLGVFPHARDDRWLVDVHETPVEKVLAMASDLDPSLVKKFLKAYEPFRS